MNKIDILTSGGKKLGKLQNKTPARNFLGCEFQLEQKNGWVGFSGRISMGVSFISASELKSFLPHSP